MNARGNNYRVVSPTGTGMLHVDLNRPAREVLAVIQHKLQLKYDRKVPVKEVFTGVLLGKIKPEQFPS